MVSTRVNGALGVALVVAAGITRPSQSPPQAPAGPHLLLFRVLGAMVRSRSHRPDQP